jgi:hypothetical protein
LVSAARWLSRARLKHGRKACCCPSRPMVRVLMPATQSRSYWVDLLLCGHHFRLSQWTLAAAGAVAPGDAGPTPRRRIGACPALTGTAWRDLRPAEARPTALPSGPVADDAREHRTIGRVMR